MAKVPAMRSTTVRLSDDLWARVKAQAEREGLPMAHFIREALVGYLALQRRAEDGEQMERLDERVTRIEAELRLDDPTSLDEP